MSWQPVDRPRPQPVDTRYQESPISPLTLGSPRHAEHRSATAPPSESPTTSTTNPPLPPRPIVQPPNKFGASQPPAFAPPPLAEALEPHGPHDQQSAEEDERRSHLISRVLANTLPVRIGRATLTSIESTAKLPFYLSPWGDNQPFTVANIRKRDVFLLAGTHFGAEALGASAVTLVEKSIEHAVSETTVLAAEHGGVLLAAIGGIATPKKTVKRKVGLDTVVLRIKHRLMGEAATLAFQGSRDAGDWLSCAKGWFCPYLYASGREPSLQRYKEFEMCSLAAPRLAADATVAPILLECMAESNTAIVAPFCPWQGGNPNVPHLRRIAIMLVGISPYRTLTTWSQARIPNEARLAFHVFTHVPAIVLPAREDAPLLSWSPWTVEQMLDTQSRYSPDQQVHELMTFIKGAVDGIIVNAERDIHWEQRMKLNLRLIIDAVREASEGVRRTSKDSFELDRAGIVVLRY